MKSIPEKRKHFAPKTRKKVLEMQKNRCKDCGIKFPYLQFHHIDGNSSNNDITNCIALCPNCHILRQMRMKKSKKSLMKLPTIGPIKLPKTLSTQQPRSQYFFKLFSN